MTERQFFVGVVSRTHVQVGVKGGFMQLNHGKKAPLQRLHAGDGTAFYSPKATYPDGEPCQMFTAIGTVKTGEIYQLFKLIIPANLLKGHFRTARAVR